MANPYLVKVYDLLQPSDNSTEIQEYYGVVMEYCKSLVSYSEGSRYSLVQMSLDETEKLTRDILRGVEYLHDHGYNHRDLRAPNIVYCPDDKKYKMIDLNGSQWEAGKLHEWKFQRDLHMFAIAIYEYKNGAIYKYLDDSWFMDMSAYEELIVSSSLDGYTSNLRVLWLKHFLALLKSKNMGDSRKIIEIAMHHPVITGVYPMKPDFDIVNGYCVED